MSQLIKESKPTKISLQQLVREKEEEISRLEMENAKLRNILALMPGTVFWKDREGKFLGCNNNNAHLLGYSSPDEIIGKRNSDLFDATLAAIADQIDQEIIATGKERFHEEQGLNIYKEPAVYLVSKIPLFNSSGNTVGLLGVSFDITERKKMENDLKIAKEKADAANQAKSQFLAVVNHELSTPLASIIGLIDLIKQGELTADEEKNIIDTIGHCSHNLLALVHEILDFSRIENGKYNLNMTAVDFSAAIDEVYRLLSMDAKRKGLELHISLDTAIEKEIVTDPRVLHRILVNLISNAIKFTETGSVTLQVNVLSQNERNITLDISVIDTGKGIPAEKLELIFEPFQQLGNAYTRQSSRQGTGLGLTIVKKLAELLGATIHVSSKPDCGSTFSLTGEFEICSTETTTTKASPQNKIIPSQKKSSAEFGKLRVLLVEDDAIIQYIHNKMLEGFNCSVNATTHGVEAIKCAAQHDLIFVDLSLPDISGFEVIKSIREQYPDITIVALTAYTGNNEKQACLQAGANEFVSKPISRTQLEQLLKRHTMI